PPPPAWPDRPRSWSARRRRRRSRPAGPARRPRWRRCDACGGIASGPRSWAHHLSVHASVNAGIGQRFQEVRPRVWTHPALTPFVAETSQEGPAARRPKEKGRGACPQPLARTSDQKAARCSVEVERALGDSMLTKPATPATSPSRAIANSVSRTPSPARTDPDALP